MLYSILRIVQKVYVVNQEMTQESGKWQIAEGTLIYLNKKHCTLIHLAFAKH